MSAEYGRHLRKVVERHLAGPIADHRSVCDCKRCKASRSAPEQSHTEEGKR
jgi:hypothetical protein